MFFINGIVTKNALRQVQYFHLYRNLLGKVSFNLSDIGEGIREVVVKEWHVKEGDKVSQFDDICEVQSDKASVTITSRFDGIISKLHYKIDETAYVGKPLVDIETESSEEIVQPSTESSDVFDNISESSDVTLTTEDNPNVQCIPSVRRLANEHKIDLSKIRGTGKNGRILKEDVLKFLDEPISGINIQQIVTEDKDKIEPIKGFKKAMSNTMTEALKIPHFVYGDEMKLNELSRLRKVLKDKHEVKLSFLPFFVKAVSNAVNMYPIMNSSVDEKVENIIYHKAHNIGIAVDSVVGLAVPVIKNVQALSVTQISEEIRRILKEGKDGKFSLSDLTGATFTISNIGTIGGTHTKPVIAPPQVAMMALGKSQILPRFDANQNITAEEIVVVSTSADHRVLDGATVAKFVQQVKKQLENPYLLFLNV